MLQYAVIDEGATIGKGLRATYSTEQDALDHAIRLESGAGRTNFGVFRLSRCIYTESETAEARKRAGVADSAEHKPVPPSAYEKIAALIVSELRDLEGEEQVSRAVYEDLVSQNQTLAKKVSDLEAAFREAKGTAEHWIDMHRDKCLELEDEFKRIDKIRAALDEE